MKKETVGKRVGVNIALEHIRCFALQFHAMDGQVRTAVQEQQANQADSGAEVADAQSAFERSKICQQKRICSGFYQRVAEMQTVTAGMERIATFQMDAPLDNNNTV